MVASIAEKYLSITQPAEIYMLFCIEKAYIGIVCCLIQLRNLFA